MDIVTLYIWLGICVGFYYGCKWFDRRTLPIKKGSKLPYRDKPYRYSTIDSADLRKKIGYHAEKDRTNFPDSR